ncbi:hypothetical protein F4703DRAFT_1844372 [Phycomyces blakesleeanus]
MSAVQENAVPSVQENTAAPVQETTVAPVQETTEAPAQEVTEAPAQEKPVTSINDKIRKQFNFYFGDSNLPYDKYLWTLTGSTGTGWVPIEKVASFKKMQTICDDLNTIIAALKEVPSDLLEIDEEAKNIRRKTTPVEVNHEIRSIYVNNLPLVDAGIDDRSIAAENMIALQNELEELFETVGEVLALRFKKFHNKMKGSAIVEFATPELSEKAAAKEWEFRGTKLFVQTSTQHAELKKNKPVNKPFNKHYKKHYEFNAFRPAPPRPTHNNKRKGDHEHKKQNKFAKKEQTVKETVDEEMPTAAPVAEAPVAPVAEAPAAPAETEAAPAAEVPAPAPAAVEEKAQPEEAKPVEEKAE